MLSSELDELVIWQILTQIQQEVPQEGLDPETLMKRLVSGVETKLVTSNSDPAQGIVTKLVALYDSGTWKPAFKILDTLEKIANPDRKRGWRLYNHRGRATADLLALQEEDVPAKKSSCAIHST